MLPLEFIWYIALQKKHWSRHYWVVITGKGITIIRSVSNTVLVTYFLSKVLFN